MFSKLRGRVNMKYPVNEIFETIQGEASFTGTPSVFVRLQGCPVGCPWCDTKHTWITDDYKQIGAQTMTDKDGVKDSDSFAVVHDQHIVQLAKNYYSNHVVFTGGEPCLYDLRPVTEALIEEGRTVQIETSGTQEIKCDHRTFVTLSPKFDMPGGLEVLDDAFIRADEIKIPVGKSSDIDRVRDRIEEINRPSLRHKPVWLQPLSQSKKATELCIEAATLLGYRVSIQTHKFLEVR